MKYLLVVYMLPLVLLLSGCPAVVLTGAGAGVVAAEDRRTVGTMAEDEGIELKALNRATERFGDKIHLNVTSYNRRVLLTGEAPDRATREELHRIAHGVENVRNVFNEVTVGPPSSVGARSKDTLITSKVKARLVDSDKVNALHVKVVTEADVVYLMGLLKRDEAREAVALARTTEDVKRVVTLFEYVD